MADTRSEHDAIRTRLIRATRARLPRADELLDLALKRGRRRDFADRSFIRPFERLLEACDAEADLSVLGIRALRVDVLRFLRNLLRFEDFEAACPSVLSRSIQAPHSAVSSSGCAPSVEAGRSHLGQSLRTSTA